MEYKGRGIGKDNGPKRKATTKCSTFTYGNR